MQSNEVRFGKCCFAAQIRRGKRFNQRFPKYGVGEGNRTACFPNVPCDEFDGENEEIARHIRDDFLADKVAEQFSGAMLHFGASEFMGRVCIGIAEEIKVTLEEGGGV